MAEWQPKTDSCWKFRGRLALLILSTSIAGCQGEPADLVDNAPPAAALPTVSETTLVEESSTPSTQAPRKAVLPQLTPPSRTGQSAVLESPLESPEKRMVREIVDRLTTPGIEMHAWEQAHQQLIGMGPAAVSVLEEKLRHGSEMERELAATTFALLGPDATDAVEALTVALNDPSRFVRANAAAALTQLPDAAAAAVPVLISLLESTDPQLRQMAAMNLNTIGIEAQPHIEELSRALATETAPEVLVPVVELLGRIGPAANPAVPQLRQIAFDQPGEVGRAASHAIERITVESESP